LIAAVALGALAAGAVLPAFLSPGRFAEADFDRIAPGMSPAEVEAVLRGPAAFSQVVKGSVRDDRTFVTNDDPAVQRDQGHAVYDFRQWTAEGWADTAFAVVVFDRGQVVCRYFSRQRPGLWHRITAPVRGLF
jgi:hypothetical protein